MRDDAVLGRALPLDRGWYAITPKQNNTTWLTAAILKVDMTSYFRSGCSDFDEIWQPEAE